MISSNKTKGFTLVELLIVIVVIAILAAISIVAYNGVTNKARDDERASDARSILNAAASYNADNDKWPTLEEVVKYQTIKLSEKAITGLGGSASPVTPAPEPDDTHKHLFGFAHCMDGTAVSGVKVTYWKDVLGNGETNHKIVMKTGKCS